MLVLKAKFLSASELDARGNYPPSSLVALLTRSGETLNLLSDPATFKALSGLEQFADVAVACAGGRWTSAAWAARGVARRTASRSWDLRTTRSWHDR